MEAALRMPRYRGVAKSMAQSQGLLGEGGASARRRKGGGREAKAEEEAILRGIIENNLDIT